MLLQAEVMSEFGWLASFVLVHQQAAVDLLLALEPKPRPAQLASQRAPDPLTTTNLRCLRGLFTPEARRAVLPLPPPPPPVSLGVLNRVARSSEKAMWLAFHWTAANEFITPAVLGSSTAKAAFHAATTVEDLRVNLGSWRSSPTRPTPPWSALKRAHLWNPTWARLQAARDLVSQPPLVFEVSEHRGGVRVVRPMQADAVGGRRRGIFWQLYKPIWHVFSLGSIMVCFL